MDIDPRFPNVTKQRHEVLLGAEKGTRGGGTKG